MHRPRRFNNQRQPYFNNQQQPYPHGFQWRPNEARGFQWHNLAPDPRTVPMGMQNYNEDHWCETCDRGFPTLDMLEKHKLQHQKCNIDGCQFIAHPKVVTKHIQMQHSSGLFKKIAKLNNPEEIKKWIDERKKKYPTKLNVEKKAAEIKEKIERGEKMGLKYDKQKRNMPSADNKRKHVYNQNHHKAKKVRHSFPNDDKVINKKIFIKKDPNTLPTLINDKKLKPFTGISDLVIDYDMDDEVATEQDHSSPLIEDDEVELQDSLINYQKPTVCGALSSLICNYGSSDDEIVSTDPIQKSTLATRNVQKQKEMCNKIIQTSQVNSVESCNVKLNEDRNSNNDSEPEEVKIIKKTDSETDIPSEQISIKSVANKNLKRNYNNQNKKAILNRRVKNKLPSTLLQKLLYTEIRQERNTVLQSIRYIIKHNYFDNSK